jgi:CheY-like chemotaxis protein
MLTTEPGPHRVTRRWRVCRGVGSSRSNDLRGAERIDWAFREIPPREDQRDGVRAFPITQERRQMNATKVLCVENHPEYMGALKYMLEAAGYEVVAATTGGQALRLLTDLHVDGVLLEYDLPDATGSAVRAEMKRIKPDIPVLLFAGIGSQTPFLLRFFDSYLRNSEQPEVVFDDLDA